ncbi:hypothetical protein [Planococcus sp. YIM B11945]|uniref:hypothetical protein n=1 Tax=Planococcus sp. YIM B11945 TaxID=3435410 RepID=UPI003D7F10B2
MAEPVGASLLSQGDAFIAGGLEFAKSKNKLLFKMATLEDPERKPAKTRLLLSLHRFASFET